MKHIVIAGAGMGGLSAAINLKQKGYSVTLIEAGERAGGLARSEIMDGVTFDAGPYILLDQPGLQWAFDQLKLSLQKEVPLIKLNNVYTVDDKINFSHDLEKTASQFESIWKGQGQQYKKFVEATSRIHKKLTPHTYNSKPGPLDIIKSGHLSLIPFMLNNLAGILSKYGIKNELGKAIGIWTQVAAQTMAKAPAPMSLVPSLIHGQGAFYPKEGMGAVPNTLLKKVNDLKIPILYNTRMTGVKKNGKQIVSITTSKNKSIDCDALLCNMSAIAAYQLMGDILPSSYKKYIKELPLQSPGIAAYLHVKSKNHDELPYLQFCTTHKKLGTIAFTNPGNVLPTNDYHQARLVAPLDYAIAKNMSKEEQLILLDEQINASWWRKNIIDYKVIHKRTTQDWGQKFNLYKNSMNPVMTAEFMRKGRLPHKSPYFENLYFCGSSTHPGQWVSFAAISGVLSSNLIAKQHA